jgi:hypothetical protein
MRVPVAALLSLMLAWCAPAGAMAQAGEADAQEIAASLPDAPKPQVPEKSGGKAAGPCKVAPHTAVGADSAAGSASGSAIGAGEAGVGSGKQAGAEGAPQATHGTEAQPCPHQPAVNWYARFLNGPQVKPLSPKEKARLAMRNVLDPFNAITILGQSAIAVGLDAHSPYGPGMPGFARNVGVSYTQDLTGEFFGTFLIPSIVRQDPHYHRMPHASIPRRIGHAIVQVVWTQGDNGKGMLNYANLVGFAIDDEISNLYVPGRSTNLPSSAARYGIGLASPPIDNFITEFLPDVARRIHVRIVLVQRVIDQVAKTEGGGSQ